MCNDLAFINTAQKNFKTFPKNVSIPRMDEKKLHIREFQLKGIGRNMMQVASKKVSCKNNRVIQTVFTNCLEKDFYFSELNRCIFQISLKYIKVVTPETLFILVLRNFTFYFKIT